MKTLRLHSRGVAEVAFLLRHLARWGYHPDRRTSGERVNKSIVDCLKRYQAQHPPLVVDGVCGPKTWAVLLRPAGDEQRQGLGVTDGLDRWFDDPRMPFPRPGKISDSARLLRKCLDHYDAHVREQPMGSNRVLELEPRAQGKPWCSYWVHDRIRAVLGKWIFGGRRGSTRMDLRMARGRELIAPLPRPGDIFVLCDANGVSYHTGVVLRVEYTYMGPSVRDTKMAMNTIEGNCANRVAIREREITDQVVFWRPFPGELEWEPGLLPNAKRAGGESTR